MKVVRYSLASLVLGCVLFGPALADPTDIAPSNASAVKILDGLRSIIAKVVSLSTASGTETSSGTGFVAGDRNFLVTNYHVVSDVALHPTQYRLEYQANDGSKGALDLVALDVVNDLAVLRLSKPLHGTKPLEISPRPSRKGDTVLAIGYPLSRGLTIVTGIFNGRGEDAYQELYHYSGPINSGMSGGPAVDTAGRLVGVNVSVHRDAQSVSSLVPASKVAALLARAGKTPPTKAQSDWKAEIGQQLRMNGEQVLQDLLKKPMPVRQFDSYTSADWEDLGFSCRGTTKQETGKYKHDLDGRYCSTDSEVYLEDDSYFSTVAIATGIRTNKGMNAMRFSKLREENFKPRGDTSDYDSDFKTGFECKDRLVRLSNVRAKTVMCIRRDHRFEDLYDISFVMHTVDSDVRSLQVRVEAIGMPYAGMQSLIQRVVGAVKWKP